MEAIFNFKNITNVLFPQRKKKALVRDFEIVNITIPSHTLYRTELLCSHISTTLNIEFTLAHYIMAVFTNFIEEYISDYNTKQALRVLTTDYIEAMSTHMYISNGFEDESPADIDTTIIQIQIDSSELKRAKLILKELYSLYNTKISIDTLFSKIWLNSIIDYKNLTSKKAYDKFINSLRLNFSKKN